MKLRALAILVIITIFIGSLAGCEALNGLQNSDGNQDIVCNHIDADDNALCDTCGFGRTVGTARRTLFRKKKFEEKCRLYGYI